MNYSNYISQVDESDCGVAALAMVLKSFGSIYPIAKLRDLARTTKQGTTALGIVKAANKLGLKVDAIKADLEFLKDKDTKFPLIVHVIKNGFRFNLHIVHLYLFLFFLEHFQPKLICPLFIGIQ